MGAEEFKKRNKYKVGCCVNCVPPDRYPGCSSKCEKKKAYDEERMKMKEYLSQGKEADIYIRDSTERLCSWKKKK